MAYLKPDRLRAGANILKWMAMGSAAIAITGIMTRDMGWVLAEGLWLALAYGLTRRMTRCPVCHRSALWWNATHAEAGLFPTGVLGLKACPWCGEK